MSPMLSASNFRRSRQSNVWLQFDICFDSIEFISSSVLTFWWNMHRVQSIWVASPAFASETSVTCYDLKLLSLVKQRRRFSNVAGLNSTCYNTIQFLCNIVTGIWSGVWKLSGIQTDVHQPEGIVQKYRFTGLIMSASVSRQRILCRYVSYKLWFQYKHFVTINHLQVVSANTTFCTMIGSSVAICIFSLWY